MVFSENIINYLFHWANAVCGEDDILLHHRYQDHLVSPTLQFQPQSWLSQPPASTPESRDQYDQGKGYDEEVCQLCHPALRACDSLGTMVGDVSCFLHGSSMSRAGVHGCSFSLSVSSGLMVIHDNLVKLAMMMMVVGKLEPSVVLVIFRYVVLYSTVLYCVVLYCTVLHCTVVSCCTVVLYCVVLSLCTAVVLYCTVLHCTVLYCSVVLYCIVLCCTALYCTVVLCYTVVLYFVVLSLCSTVVLYCTVLYCTVLYCTVLYCCMCVMLYCTVLYCTMLYCTVL